MKLIGSMAPVFIVLVATVSCVGTGFAQAVSARAGHPSSAQSRIDEQAPFYHRAPEGLSALYLRHGGLPIAGGRSILGADNKLEILGPEGKAVKVLSLSENHKSSALEAGSAFPLNQNFLTWLEQEESPQEGAQYFGYELAMDGDTAFVSFDVGGAVDVYNYVDGEWTLVQQIADPQPGDQFGIGMAIDGDEAIIGANTATVHGNSWQGAAYVYTRSDGIWSQKAMLTAADGAANDLFGQTVALYGTTALIASPDATVNGNQYAGKAYIFTGSGGSWSQQDELTASDSAASYFFGHAVGLSSQARALIGSSAVVVNGVAGVGAVYAFTNSGGSWSQVQEFSPNDPTQGMGFGYALSVDGETALIGAGLAYGPDGSSRTGAAYIFSDAGGSWSQVQKLTASNGQVPDQFGDSVAISGATAVIGAWFANDAQGAAYIFMNSDSTWTQTQELLASDGMAGDYMGYTPFATSGGVALVSAYGHDSYAGAAYFFDPSNLGLTMSAPGTIGHGREYVSQTIATNNASAASPAVSATIAVPAAASFVSATATQGSCAESSGLVTCNFGQINGNAGTATANVTLKATGNVGDTIENVAGVAKATPPLSASVATTITEGGACPGGYTEYDGNLNGGQRTHSPVYRAPAGLENAILAGPSGFQLYALFQNAQFGRKSYRISGNEVHRHAPAGYFTWVVKAGNTGGTFTLCVLHP